MKYLIPLALTVSIRGEGTLPQPENTVVVDPDTIVPQDPIDPKAMNGTDTANRRLKQMKAIILHLQPFHYYAKYCNYGCWCFRDGVHQVGTGNGPPADELDKKCFLQSRCYECAQMEHPNRNCVPEQIRYSYRLLADASDPTNHWKKSIQCTDDPVNPTTGKTSEKIACRRAICECDKKLAEDLRELEPQYDESKNQKLGGFDPDTECAYEKGRGPGTDFEMKCCGNGWRFPYRHGDRKCCGDVTYDSNMLDCCDETTSDVQTLGSC